MTAPPAPPLRPASIPTHAHATPREAPSPSPTLATAGHRGVARAPVASPNDVPTGPFAPVASLRRVARLVVLGDSTAVGIGDPVDTGWRGFPVLLRDALAPADSPATAPTNLARSGARMGGVRRDQLPAAVDARPDVAVVCAGMNDTLRSDFDPAAIEADCTAA